MGPDTNKGNGYQTLTMDSFLVHETKPITLSKASGCRNLRWSTDAAHGAFFDIAMSGDAGQFAPFGIQPDSVRAAFPVELTAVLSQVSLQITELHGSANSIVWRTARSERSFSASSRWHCSTNFRASSRLVAIGRVQMIKNFCKG